MWGGALYAEICAREAALDAGAYLELSSKRIILVAFLWGWADLTRELCAD